MKWWRFEIGIPWIRYWRDILCPYSYLDGYLSKKVAYFCKSGEKYNDSLKIDLNTPMAV